MRSRSLCLLAALALLGSCGPKSVFGLTSDDNNTDALSAALAKRQLPAKPQVANATGKPMMFAVAAGSPKKLVAYDLESGKTVWTVDADVQSRVDVAGELVVLREGKNIVVRNVRDGKPRGSISVTGELVGATTDGDNV